MRTGICHRAHGRIADRDAYADASTDDCYPGGDVGAISNYESDHCAIVDANANANSDGHANTRADASPTQAGQLCTVASLARL